MPSCGVRPSVCLSRSWIMSKRINISSSKFFHDRVAPPFQFFPYQTGWRYSDGNRPNGGVECRWGRQKTRFWTNIWWLRCNCGGRSDGDVTRVIVVSWCISDRGRPDAFAADHQTTQCLFHCLVLEGVDEQIHADVQVGQEHREMIPDVQAAGMWWKTSRDERRQASSPHRGVRRPLFAQEDDEVFVTGLTLYAGDEGRSPPLVITPVFCCCRTS